MVLVRHNDTSLLDYIKILDQLSVIWDQIFHEFLGFYPLVIYAHISNFY